MSAHPEALKPIRRLTTPKTTALLLLSGSLVFVAGGVWMIEDHPFGAWSCIVFFGLCAAVGFVMLLPGSSYLELRADGFELCTMYRRSFFRWKDCGPFVVTRAGMQAMVGWRFTPDYAAQATARRFAVAVSGVEGALPDTYGLSADALAELMNRYREAA